MASGANRKMFWGVVIGVVVLDLITKLLVVEFLRFRMPVHVVGNWVTLQLVYNQGAAFGIHVGDYSRVVFTGLALVALVVLGAMVRQTDGSHRIRLLALGLVCGGAVGNLIDRIRSARGVVDFIDVGIQQLRWPTFNVADMAVTCGAITLAIVLWAEGRDLQEQPPEQEKGTAPAAP
ncbi:MAG: signal peptidase II [Gemmatimonadetes bacterium]|nr:signal peptidase II [Gemmatimonadota bacterium]